MPLSKPFFASVHSPAPSLVRLLPFLPLLLIATHARRAEGAPDRIMSSSGDAQWVSWSGDLHNTHDARHETRLNVSNVAGLEPKWVYKAAGNVSATPTIRGDILYVTDWGAPLGVAALTGGGRLHAIDRRTGQEIWVRRMSDYTASRFNAMSRSSPAIVGDLLIIGDYVNQLFDLAHFKGEGASLYAVNRWNGDLVWKTTVDDNPWAQITQSPVVFEGKIYVGVASGEEGAAKVHHACCTFQGSMVAVDVRSGAVLWKTRTAPDNHGRTDGFSGAAIWGSTPAIDEKRRVLYTATGNNYNLPPDLKACIAAYRGDPGAQQSQCYARLDAPDNYADSVLAFDLDTGAVRWAQKLMNYGAWIYSCDHHLVPWLNPIGTKCTDVDGLDFDFGQAPMLFTTAVEGKPKELIAVGQKSGAFWAFDPDARGKVVWATAVGPGGDQGGMEFGAATDGARIYAQVTNFGHVPFRLVAGPHAGEVVNGGIWAGLDAATGKLLWQTPDPSSFLPLKGLIVHPAWGPGLGKGFFGVAMGPLTVANGVVFGGSMDKEGHMYAFDAATGAILWSFASGGSVMSAPSIVDGVLYWGSGYQQGFNHDRLYAFSL